MNLRHEILNKRSSKIHLHDLILIFKCLYPHRQIVNPFEEQIYNQKDWTAVQKELVSQLIYVSCLFNQKYRTWDKYLQLQAIEEDYINALALAERELDIKKPSALLEVSTRRFYIEVRAKFGGMPFTNKQVRHESGLRKSTVHRHLQELISKDLARISGGYANRGYWYELTEKAFL